MCGRKAWAVEQAQCALRVQLTDWAGRRVEATCPLASEVGTFDGFWKRKKKGLGRETKSLIS